MRNLIWMAVICLLFSCQGEGPADLLLYNGKIWTGMEGAEFASWIAIRDGEISAVGSREDIRPFAVESIDLDGRLTLPGFNDSHVHFASAGSLLLGINLLDVNDTQLFEQRIREAADRLPEGSWITGGDWGAYEAWAMGSSGQVVGASEFRPHRSLIDEITRSHPVLVTRYDRQMGLANALALEYFNIQSEDGILEGPQLRELLRVIPEKSMERRYAETERALEECRKWGVTSVQDMSSLDQVAIYDSLKKTGQLTCRIDFSPSRLIEWKNMSRDGWVVQWDDRGGPVPAGDEWISFGTIKTHIDGIMGARSARFFGPYSDNPTDQPDWRGGWREFSGDLDNFQSMLISADSAGIQLRVHAIGDEANAILLNLLDSLDRYNGPKDRRFRLVHAQVIRDEDFSKFQNHPIVAEVQPYHVTDDMRWMEDRIGRERCRGAYAFKTLEENGCILAFGSDWPGTNASYYPINPLMGIYAAVTRQTVNGEPSEGWFPEQRIDLETSLRAYTWGSAYANFEENRKGTLRAGMLADIAVLDTDLFETEPTEWLEAYVDLTVVGGRIVHRQNL